MGLLGAALTLGQGHTNVGIVRAVAQEILPVEGRPGFDYVLIGRAATLERGFQDLRDDLRKALAGVASRDVKDKPKKRASTAKAPGKKGTG